MDTPTPTDASARAVRVFCYTVLTAALFLLGYDLYQYERFGTAGTISHGLWVLGAEHPILPAAWCLLGCGSLVSFAFHFWWSK
jgi:hypothetical protein